MARKILLLEAVGPSVSTNTAIAINPADKAATMSLTGNNFIANAASTAQAAARVTSGITSGAYYWEYAVLLTGGSSYNVGIAKSTATLTQYLGFGADSWAYNGGAAATYNNNVPTPGFPAWGVAGDIIGCAYNATTGKLWWHKNGVWIGSGNPATDANPQYSGISGTVFPAIALSTAGDSIQIVTDPALQTYQAPVGFTAGWYTTATVAGASYYVATEGFTTSPSDTPANQYYDARILADGDPVYDRTVTCAAWSRNGSNLQGQYSDAPTAAPSKTTIAIGDISLNNQDGGLDSFSTTTMRDGTVTLKLGYYGQAYSSFVTVASGVIDSIPSPEEHISKLYLRGKMARLDKAIQSALYNSLAPNAALEGTAMPFALGSVKWAPLVTLDPANLEYQLTDAPSGVVSEVRDQGLLITQAVGWGSSAGNVTPTVPNYGVRRLTNPAGRQCASFTGAVTLGSNVVAAQPFGVWAAGVPANFAKTTAANAPLTQGAGTLAVFTCTTATPGAYQSELRSTFNATVGQLYYAEIVCSAYTSGNIDVIHSNTLANFVTPITKAGTYRFAFIATAASFVISLEWGKTLCNLTLSGVNVYAASTIERLPAWLSYLCVTRGGLSAGDIDSAGTIATLDTAAPYNLAFYCQDQTRFPELLQATMDSFCGWIFEDRLGVLKVGRLALPAATSVLTLTDQELVGDITYTPDGAPGLSAQVAGIKNYSVHGQADIAGALYVPGSGDPTTAAQLQMPWLAVRKGNALLPALYATASLNAPMPTLLSKVAHVQQEANRRAGMFTQQRGFYDMSAFVDDTTSYTLNPGDTITVQTGTQPNTRQRLDLTPTPGKNLVVVGVKSRFLSNKIELRAWG